MLSLLLISAYSQEPIILVPPMFGSELMGSITDLSTHWYCSKNFKDHLIWLKDTMAVPPLFNCLASWLTVEWNYTSGLPSSRNKTYIYAKDFGGLNGMKYIDSGIFGKHFIPELIYVIEKLEKEGYVEGVDLFGAPYDWRMMPIAFDDYLAELKALVEKVYAQTGNNKVALYGISGGGNTIQKFCRFVPQDWKDKYIRQVLLHGPSYGGSGEALSVLWLQNIGFIPSIFNTQNFRDMVFSIPTIWAHLHNAPSNTDPVIIGPDGHKYYAQDIPQLMIDQGKATGDNLQTLLLAQKKVILNKIEPTGVPTYILFNSVLKTIYGLNYSAAGNWSVPEVIYTNGDDTLSAESLYYPCKNWDDGHPLVCHDLQINDEKFSHAGQLSQPSVIDIIWKVTKDESWMVPGPHIVTGTNTEGWKQMKAKK
ncbi:Lecithin:cholesterol acyltransferase family protein [Trichomonas vaginalis G3]|uniref:Lecithin:cholesterol acyltransferase family protein n=1 Tax=Trichomonas vaginalis (strain ATCC PRA-98 / G3) TaxID=412133 RepID=A2DEB6_TRIV3|nr:O-acyltransferase protein [Trichomonas vaginalis G3]EAY21334.1 Lecithin:cholesterol acyltransferase family protein [Trichomonas vaginalis G3]KAI5548929.1 O-acyltransferase protein [Trichomonas vaginalis G3]|eukprot:XP_001582320.1 Lecithin:cholesterol acyltransferase family protein [Trichomonas vaginalis G3]